MRTLSVAASAAAIMLACGTPASAAKTLPDDGRYSMYNVDVFAGVQSVNITVCDAIQCDAQYSQSFDHACAILESAPKAAHDVMTRDIYVLDKRTSATDPMTLTVLRRIDDGGSGIITFTPVKTITLDITGGANANCKMAENPHSVYLGTDLSNHSVIVDKKKLKAAVGWSGPVTILSADSRGYISISAGSGMIVLGPDGVPLGSGGILANQVGDQNALVVN
jgi:hypothetical protein